jgi:hypothetical protein
MKRLPMLALVLGTMLPTVATAQEDIKWSSGQQVLRGDQFRPLPVTLDFSLPTESEWLAKINASADAAPATADSPAARALNASVGTAEQPAQQPAADAGACPQACCNPCAPRWPPPGVMTRGTWEFEYGTQYWRSPIFIASPFSTSFIPQIVRVGKMWSDPDPSRERWRGNWEGLLELDCLPIISGAGNIVIGGSALLRYNLSWRPKRFMPYVQLGGGGVYTDAFMFPGSPTGSGFNFLLQVGYGSHFFINKKWAITTEGSYIHMSNGGIAGNAGYNILGGIVGVTRFFGKE